jgi:hypothetical protein
LPEFRAAAEFAPCQQAREDAEKDEEAGRRHSERMIAGENRGAGDNRAERYKHTAQQYGGRRSGECRLGLSGAPKFRLGSFRNDAEFRIDHDSRAGGRNDALMLDALDGGRASTLGARMSVV